MFQIQNILINIQPNDKCSKGNNNGSIVLVPEFGNETSVLNKHIQIDNNDSLEFKFAILLSNWMDGTDSEGRNPLLEVLSS